MAAGQLVLALATTLPARRRRARADRHGRRADVHQRRSRSSPAWFPAAAGAGDDAAHRAWWGSSGRCCRRCRSPRCCTARAGRPRSCARPGAGRVRRARRAACVVRDRPPGAPPPPPRRAAAGGAARAADVVARAGHPARALDAHGHPVLRHGVRPAVGRAVPGGRAGDDHRAGERHADAARGRRASSPGPLFGEFAARHPMRRSYLVLTVIGTHALVWAAVLLVPPPAPRWLLVLLVVVIGTGGPGSMIGFDYARTFNPRSRQGAAVGIVNVGGFVASLLVALGDRGGARPGRAATRRRRSAWRGRCSTRSGRSRWSAVLVARRRARRKMEAEGVVVPPLRAVAGARRSRASRGRLELITRGDNRYRLLQGSTTTGGRRAHRVRRQGRQRQDHAGRGCSAATSPRRGAPVLAVDADINQHLGAGARPRRPAAARRSAPTCRGSRSTCAGTNPRIASRRRDDQDDAARAAARGCSTSTRPASCCSRYAATTAEGVRYLVTGAFDEADIGVACYHSKIGAVELCLNHLVDGPGRVRRRRHDRRRRRVRLRPVHPLRPDGAGQRADPARRRRLPAVRRHAGGHGVALRVLGNKVADADDVDFLREQVGDDLLGWLGQSPWVRAAERGAVAPVAALEPANRAVLDAVLRRARRPRSGLGRLPPRHRRVPPAQRRRVGQPRGRRRPGRAGRPRVRARPSVPSGPDRGPLDHQEDTVSLDVPTARARPRRARRARRRRSSSPSSATRCRTPGRWSAPPPTTGPPAPGARSPSTRCRRRPSRSAAQLLRALASDAIRGALERHFGVVLAFQNCHRVAAFAPAAVDGDGLPRVRLAARPGAQPVAGAARLLTPDRSKATFPQRRA